MTSTAIAAARLLREYAEELKRSHTIFSSGAWPEGESEAKAAYEQHIAIASALEATPAQCLYQIQEPAPATALDALREAEAALEVAIARILKANPGHSISVTSEAKALVIVRAALATTPAAAPDLHAQIMNIPLGIFGTGIGDIGIAYRAGHQAARHAAAELASSIWAAPAAAAPVVLPEPDFWVRPGATIHPDRGWQCWSNDGTATGAFHADTVRALLAGVSAPAAQAVPLKLIEAINTACGSNEWQGDALVTELLEPACRAIASLAPQAQADARDAVQEVLMEHSGCGSNTQVDMLTVRLNPGDKVVMHKSRITQGFDRANRAAQAAAKGE